MTDPTTTKAIETIVETVVKDLLATAKDAGRAAWERVRWLEAARQYRDQLKDRYGTMRVLGKPKPIPLEGIFTEVYVLDKPTAWRRFNLEELKQLQAEAKPFDGWDKPKRIHALRLATQESKLFILGKPGAGKTTFLRYLTLQADKLNKLPIFVSLIEWVESGLDLMAFLEGQFAICQFPSARQFIEQLLKNGQALVLFDGLDEVNEAADQRLKTTRTLADFAQQHNHNQFIITCRIAASDYSFEKFTYVELADFTDEQVRTFARKWFADSPKIADRFWDELKKNAHWGLRELAHSPLLLTLLCLNYEETLTFPARRVEIYEEALDALLKKWDASRGIKRDEIYKGLSLGRKRQLLTHIAADYFQRGQIFFSLRDLTQKVEAFLARLSTAESGGEPDGEAVVKAIEAQHGLLVERARGIYSFSHLTLQEYFAARYIAENADKGSVAGLMAHAADRRWYEVFLLTASLLPEGDDFFRRFRQTLDNWISDKHGLSRLFSWMSTKAQDYSAVGHPVVARACALGLALDLARVRALARARDLDRALDLDRVLDLVHALALDRALGIDNAFVLDFNLALDRVLALDLARTHDIALGFDLDRILYFHLTRDRDRARELGLMVLAEDLQALSVPPNDARAKQWQAFENALQKILIQHRNIGYDWKLSYEEERMLKGYEQATLLLAECLQLAAVSTPQVRKAIEESLLLPPGEWEPW